MSPTLPCQLYSRFVARVWRGAWVGLLASAAVARGESSPQADAAMQAAAPEVLVIEVTSVKTTPGKDGVQVDAQAKVVSVTRTKTNLIAGDVVALSYAHPTLPPFQPGSVMPSGPAQVVEANATYQAYLEGGPPPSAYMPVAERMSFEAILNPRTFTPADLTVYSNDLGQAQFTRENGRWFAKLNDAGPKLPLMATGETAPTLLENTTLGEIMKVVQIKQAIPPNFRAGNILVVPDSGFGMLPSVLVYEAGNTTAPDDSKTVLQVERALIYDRETGRPVGDALWAVRGSNGGNGLPEPIWHVSFTTLTVENPFQKTIQEISLTPKADKK